jgi:hypothetical protein
MPGHAPPFSAIHHLAPNGFPGLVLATGSMSSNH